jgi:hypothetical protein
VPRRTGTQDRAGLPAAASAAVVEPRQRGPLGERLTDAELEPIRVHTKGGAWQIDYGSYVQGYHDTREDAIATALTAATRENRELSIERPRRISETAQHSPAETSAARP